MRCKVEGKSKAELIIPFTFGSSTRASFEIFKEIWGNFSLYFLYIESHASQATSISRFSSLNTDEEEEEDRKGNGGQAKPITGVVRRWVSPFHRPITQSSPLSRIESCLWILDPTQCPSLWFLLSLSVSLSYFLFFYRALFFFFFLIVISISFNHKWVAIGDS